MQAVHKTMFQAMGTATWQGRRDLMSTLFSTRQPAMHDAAEKSQAASILPGNGRPGMRTGRGLRKGTAAY